MVEDEPVKEGRNNPAMLEDEPAEEGRVENILAKDVDSKMILVPPVEYPPLVEYPPAIQESLVSTMILVPQFSLGVVF